jgi:hypothetical protein
MIVSMLRVIVGFVVACLVAGLAIVLFVYTPLELVREHGGDRASEAGLLALAAATHTAVFAAPFALIAAAFAEWQRIGSWLYYALVGVAIATVGFAAQSWTESPGLGEGSILNSYAVTAFIVTGFVAGVGYWLVAGRAASAHGGRPRGTVEIIPPPRQDPAPG